MAKADKTGPLAPNEPPVGMVVPPPAEAVKEEPKKRTLRPRSQTLILADRLSRVLDKMPPAARKWALAWLAAEYDPATGLRVDMFTPTEVAK